jgi:hypothetical protein
MVGAGGHVREHIIQGEHVHGFGKVLSGQGPDEGGSELEVLCQLATLVDT